MAGNLPIPGNTLSISLDVRYREFNYTCGSQLEPFFPQLPTATDAIPTKLSVVSHHNVWREDL